MDLAGNVRDLDIAVEMLGRFRSTETIELRSKHEKKRKDASRVLADKRDPSRTVETPVCLEPGSACGKGGRLEQLCQLRIAAKKMRLHARIVHFPESRCHPRMARSAQEDATVLGSINDLEIVHDILLNSRGASNLNRFDDAHLRVGRDDPC